MVEPAIARVNANEAQQLVEPLAALLVDCVNGGASVGFMAPLDMHDAYEFWSRVVSDVREGRRALIAATVGDMLVGTAQVVFAIPENQPHRADISKVLVHSSMRGRGIATRLMKEVEQVAKSEGKTVLVLDTVTGSIAERLYERCGWTRVGVIPDYALMPDGSYCSTTFFYKQLP